MGRVAVKGLTLILVKKFLTKIYILARIFGTVFFLIFRPRVIKWSFKWVWVKGVKLIRESVAEEG